MVTQTDPAIWAAVAVLVGIVGLFGIILAKKEANAHKPAL